MKRIIVMLCFGNIISYNIFIYLLLPNTKMTFTDFSVNLTSGLATNKKNKFNIMLDYTLFYRS
jgi:hypothetical protein